MMVPNAVGAGEWRAALERRTQRYEDVGVERHHTRPVVARGSTAPFLRPGGRALEQQRQVEQLGPRRLGAVDALEQLDPADDVVEAPLPQRRQNAPHVLRDQRE